MIDPIEEYVEVYTRKDDHFIRQGIYGSGKQFNSPIPNGATITIDKIFEW